MFFALSFFGFVFQVAIVAIYWLLIGWMVALVRLIVWIVRRARR